ncbi:MAG: cytochrome c [Chitinophagaceae bacterium]|nr:cytochrome c [Chitinophagaceae bacterium]MBK8953016.1 cytochrome c [Chitinophagaceae bacterium]
MKILCKYFFIVFIAFGIIACNNGKPELTEPEPYRPGPLDMTAPPAFSPPVKESDIVIGKNINPQLSKQGEVLYNTKCKVCHKINTETLVGPGLKNITKRRSPAWIMNIILYTGMMLQNDPEARKQYEIFKVTMPALPLTNGEARSLFEFFRKNDL